MTENYIQYAGVSKENIDETDIEKAISDIRLMDEETWSLFDFGYNR
jgi:hypothetical protein